MDELTARARELRDSGTERQAALTELNKAIALHRMEGDPAASKAAVAEVYGDELRPVPAHDAPHENEISTEQGAKTDGRGGRSESLRLPAWCGVRSYDPPAPAPQLINGLLRRGHVGLLVARAKSNKSWGAVALSVAVATGSDWMGFTCSKGRVLFIDPELDPRSLDRRFSKVAHALEADPQAVDSGVLRWSLRGVTVEAHGVRRAPTIADVTHDIETRVQEGDLAPGEIALVIIDSCSALLDGDENASLTVRGLSNACLQIAELTGASVLLIHHEAKAASGDREGIARGRGSSTWGDAPDLVLSLVETFPPGGLPSDYLQDGERAFCLEVAAIREFPPVDPKRLIWRYPLLVPDSDGITDEWKPKSSQQTAGRASGESRKAKAHDRANECVMALLAHMYRYDVDSTEGIPASEAAEICSEVTGGTVKTQTLKSYIEASEWLDVHQKSPQRWAVVPRHPKQKLPPLAT